MEATVDGSGGLHVQRKGVTGPGIVHAEIHTPSEYIPLEVNSRPGANFGLLLLSYILMLAGTFGYIGAMYYQVTGVIENFNEAQANPGMEPVAGPSGFLLISLAVMLVGVVFNSSLSLLYLHRAWAYIQDLPNVATTRSVSRS